jgi:hypothetical protein
MSREIKWVKVLKEVSVCVKGDFVCDNCGKHLDITKQNGTYYSVFSGHDEWGNDSCDSIEESDACCDECLTALVNEWLEGWKGYSTAYIDIKRKRFSDLRRGEEE